MPSLIVGANGFIARVLAAFLRSWHEQADGVFNVHRTQDLMDLYGDIYPAEALETLDSKHYDCVYLLAAHIPYGNMNGSDARLVESNIHLVHRVVQTFPNSRLVFASSVSVHDGVEGIISDSSPFLPRSLYAWSKLAGEGIVKQHRNSIVLRFSSVYGKGMKPVTFLPAIILQAKRQSEITLLGDGSRQQDYLHVSDAAMACFLAARNDAMNSFIVAYGESLSNLQAATTIVEFFPGVRIGMTGQDTTQSRFYDIRSARETLGYRPAVSLQEGIREIVQSL